MYLSRYCCHPYDVALLFLGCWGVLEELLLMYSEISFVDTEMEVIYDTFGLGDRRQIQGD